MEFLKIRKDDLKLILDWRTSAFVTRYMFTDLTYNLDNQQKWFQTIKVDSDSRYWIFSSKGKKIGLVSINNIDWKHKRATWAFYVGEPEYSMVVGLIGPHVYNYVFSVLGLHKVTGEVMAENEAVRKMHLSLGCREVGYYKDHIYKYDMFHDVYLYEMLASDWNKAPEKFKKMLPKVEGEI